MARACFKVSVDELARGTDVPMDAENLLTIEVGCYRCEAAYEPRLARRACPGDPFEVRGAGVRWR